MVVSAAWYLWGQHLVVLDDSLSAFLLSLWVRSCLWAHMTLLRCPGGKTWRLVSGCVCGGRLRQIDWLEQAGVYSCFTWWEPEGGADRVASPRKKDLGFLPALLSALLGCGILLVPVKWLLELQPWKPCPKQSERKVKGAKRTCQLSPLQRSPPSPFIPLSRGWRHRELPGKLGNRANGVGWGPSSRPMPWVSVRNLEG